MSAAYWKDISSQINIGVYNTQFETTQGPVDCSIRVRDFKPFDVYPEEVRKRA